MALIVALRTAEPGAERAALERLIASSEAPVLRPGPLSPEAVTDLVRIALGRDPATDFAFACHEASGGNPFYLNALLDDLQAQGIEPSAAEAACVRTLGPRAVSRAVLLRLLSLAPEAPDMARALAILATAPSSPRRPRWRTSMWIVPARSATCW